MKTIFITLFSIGSFSVAAQIQNHTVSLTLGNNGQIADLFDKFYWNGAYGPADDTYDYKHRDFKLNFGYEFQLKSNYSIHARVGFGMIRNVYDISNVEIANGISAQKSVNIALGSKYNFQIDKFQISTGLELPFYFISEYKDDIHWDNQADGVVTDIHTSTTGGYAVGLNSITSLKFFPTEKFFISADVVFGYMYFDLGGKYSVSDRTVNASDQSLVSDNSFEMDRTYSKSTFTKPEFQLGIGFRVGSEKNVK